MTSEGSITSRQGRGFGNLAGPVLVLALVAAATLVGLFRPLDNWLTDRRFSLDHRSPSGTIVFVEIDPASLRQIGVWPWPRHVYADLLDKLMAMGVADTVLDIDFSSASSEAEDAALEAALQRAGGYVSLAAFRQFSPVTGKLEATKPLQRFLTSADAVVVNVIAEPDGIVRRYPAGMTVGSTRHPTLAEALSGQNLPADDKFALDFGIDASSVDRISVADLLAGKVDSKRLAGKQVVIGASAQELRDIYTVPRFGTVPGGLLQIIGAETLKQHRALRDSGAAVPLLIALAFGLLFVRLRGRSPLDIEIATGVVLMLAIEAAALLLQARFGILLGTAPVISALLGFMTSAVFQELETKRRLHLAAAHERDIMGRILDRVISDNFDGVLIIDHSGVVVAASQLAETLLGDGGTLPGRTIERVLPELLSHAVQQALSDVDGDEPPAAPSEVTLEIAGVRRTLEYMITRSEVDRGVGDAVPHVACLTFRDISVRRRHEERLAFVARHDPLTGALSRLCFVETIAAELNTGEGLDQGLTVILLELGRFRIVNDTFGHPFGDRVLKEVVARLESLELLAVGRVGGDTFALARRGLMSAAEAKMLCQAIIAKIVEPYSFEEGRAVLSARAGVTSTTISGLDGNLLLSHADMALSAAKANPGDAVEIFTPAMNMRLIIKREMEAALRQALQSGQFFVHYQPQVSLACGETIGVEALLRWRHPALGSVSPDKFIPAAEETGLIVELGRFVLETACKEVASWPGQLRLAVNVSPAQFELGDVVHDVQEALAKSGLPADRLDLEITEGVFVDTGHAATAALKRLQGLGVGVALDDFGTGYSSLSYLGRLPIDTLKIDRSFICNLPGDSEARAIVAAVVTLSHTLGKGVVAEGIETTEQADLLTSLGCEIGQGYLFGRPVAAEELRARLASSERDYLSAVAS